MVHNHRSSSIHMHIDIALPHNIIHISTIILYMKDIDRSAALLKASNVSPSALFTDAVVRLIHYERKMSVVCGDIHLIIKVSGGS